MVLILFLVFFWQERIFITKIKNTTNNSFAGKSFRSRMHKKNTAAWNFDCDPWIPKSEQDRMFFHNINYEKITSNVAKIRQERRKPKRCTWDNYSDQFIGWEVLNNDEMPTCSMCGARYKWKNSWNITTQRLPKYLAIRKIIFACSNVLE